MSTVGMPFYLIIKRKRGQELESEQGGSWEELEGGKERGKRSNYIIISKNGKYYEKKVTHFHFSSTLGTLEYMMSTYFPHDSFRIYTGFLLFEILELV